jgi:hypothetical protein
MRALAALCLGLGALQASPQETLGAAIARLDEREPNAARELLRSALALETSEPARADLAFVLGVACARDQARDEARAAFAQALSLAGPGARRLDASYDLAWMHLDEAEELYARIPEVAGRRGAAAAGQPTSGTAPLAAHEDALPHARAAYLRARSAFLERLRLDTRHVDTRANLELVVRRLCDLERIEQDRAQQKKQQQQQKPAQQDQEDRDGEAQPDAQEADDSSPHGDPDPNRQGDEQARPEQPEPDAEPRDEPAKASPSAPQSEPPPSPAPQGAGGDEQAGEPLSREERLRLLDKLSELERAAEALLERLRAVGRASVERDW